MTFNEMRCCRFENCNTSLCYIMKYKEARHRKSARSVTAMNQNLCDYLSHFLNKYENKLKYENKSINTINSYKNTLNQFISYLSCAEEEISLETIKPSIIYSFFDYKENLLKKQGTLKKSTIKLNFIHIKSFFSFIECESDDLLDFTKLFKNFKFKAIKPEPKSLNHEDEQKFLNAVEMKKAKNDDFVALRDSLIIKTMIYTGIRVSEMLMIKYKDYVSEDDENIYSIHVIGKGNKPRTVYAIKDLIDDELLELKKTNDADSFVCVTKNGKIIPRQNIDKIIKAFCNRANMQATSSHKLRHTFSSNFLHVHGGNLIHLQEILGHGDVKTTMIYVNPRQEDVKRGFLQALYKNNK